MTVHSGTFGPVHTGIVSDIKLFGARRLQRRLEPRPTTSATGPSRCVPPPCGTTAQPCPGLPFSEDKYVPSYVLLAESCPGSPASNQCFNALNSRVHPLKEKRGRGCDPGATLSRMGRTGTRMGVSWWEVFPGPFLCPGRFRFPCFLAVLRWLSPRRRVAVTSVASPAFCSLCCLGSPRLPETQIEGTV